MLAMVSCSHDGWERIPAKEVRRLLPSYAMLSSSLQSQGLPDSVRAAAYRQFFADEGYTLADWDSSMRWYATHDMPLYHDFFRLASDSLSHLVGKLQAQQDSISRQTERTSRRMGYTLDSVNLLRLGVERYLSGELINQSFSFVPSTPYSGVRVELSTAVYGLPPQGGGLLQLELNLHQQDSTSLTRQLIIRTPGRHSLSLQTIYGKSVVRVSGRLIGIVPKLQPEAFIWTDSLRLVRYPSADTPPPPIVELEPTASDEIEEL